MVRLLAAAFLLLAVEFLNVGKVLSSIILVSRGGFICRRRLWTLAMKKSGNDENLKFLTAQVCY
jgi:hypothetical protein